MADCAVTSLTVYPVKGCQGVSLDRVDLRRGGIPGDRELMFVKDGESYSQLDHPRLARVRVEVEGPGRLRLSTPEAGAFVVERSDEGDETRVKLVYNDITVRDEGDALAAWACEAMGEDERPNKEPLQTLSRYRRIENGYASGVAFGAYMAVAREGELAVGDSLEVAKR